MESFVFLYLPLLFSPVITVCAENIPDDTNGMTCEDKELICATLPEEDKSLCEYWDHQVSLKYICPGFCETCIPSIDMNCEDEEPGCDELDEINLDYLCRDTSYVCQKSCNRCNSTTDLPQVCRHSEFQCPNGTCIPNAWLCDDVDDCGDNADEIESTCTECRDHEDHCQYISETHCGGNIEFRNECPRACGICNEDNYLKNCENEDPNCLGLLNPEMEYECFYAYEKCPKTCKKCNSTIVSPQCPTNTWRLSVDGPCYILKVRAEGYTFDEAQQECFEQDMKVAEPTDSEALFISMLLDEDGASLGFDIDYFWLGAKFNGRDMVWNKGTVMDLNKPLWATLPRHGIPTILDQCLAVGKPDKLQPEKVYAAINCESKFQSFCQTLNGPP